MHALCCPIQRSEMGIFTAKPQRTQMVSRSREKAPRNADPSPMAERETAGRAPVPYARDAPTSVSMVAGADFVRPTTQL